MSRRIGRPTDRSAGAAPVNRALVEMAGALSRSHRALAIQLSLDPLVSSLDFVRSLRLNRQTVPIAMIVAERGGRRWAFDIVDERPQQDLDQEGLLLMALRLHGIDLVECDGPSLHAEPRASNCRRIWRHRDRYVEPVLQEALPHAFGNDRVLDIAELGKRLGLANPVPTICSLVCRRKLAIDLDVPFDETAVVLRTRPEPVDHLPRNRDPERVRRTV